MEQSLSMIAAALVWKLNNIKVDPVMPVVAQKPLESGIGTVAAGYVAGIRQIAIGYRNGKEVISLDFQAYVGAEEEYDAVSIEGVPSVNMKIIPCVHGDEGTVSMVVNSIPKVINAPPGLVTMKDLPVPSATPGNLTKFIAGSN